MHTSASDALDQANRTFTVSQLNRKVKSLLEIHLPLVWVEGEISNISRPSSGHWYFTLKDSNAQVSCAMFKRRNSAVTFEPKVGDHLKLRAQVSLYEGRGNYQLIVEHMEQAGFGLLQRRFEELKDKLAGEGLFDADRKQAIPTLPRHLAVVTSPSGAAVRDVLTVLARRFPALPVTVVPSMVQGDDAPRTLINALQQADEHADFDVILLCRGGGSIEDLWAFNNEALARAIHACETPVVCGVGHEVDVTIADFVADLRAPTPSAAAELLSPNRDDLQRQFAALDVRMANSLRQHIAHYAAALHHLGKRLKHPRDKLEQQSQRLDHLEIRLTEAISKRQQQATWRYGNLYQRLHHASPGRQVAQFIRRVAELDHRQQHSMGQALTRARDRFTNATHQLELVSPLATINRGYSITRTATDDVVRRTAQTKAGDIIQTRVSDGLLTSTITQVDEDASPTNA